MLKHCGVCNKDINADKSFVVLSKMWADNIYVCPQCIDWFLKHRVMYPFTCKYCGHVFEMTKMMFATRHGDGNLSNICSECKKKVGHIKAKETNLRKYGHTCSLHSPQAEEKTTQTNLRRYGYVNAAQAPEVKEKIQETFDRKYGMHPWKTKEKHEMRKNTCLERYGVDNPSKSPFIIEKIIDTFIQKYGYVNAAQAPEVKEKIQETFDRKYGMHPWKTKEKQEMRKNTCLERYGVEYASQCPEIKEMLIKTYNARTPEQRKQTRIKMAITNAKRTEEDKEKSKQKMRNTLYNRYGVNVEYASQVPCIRAKMVKSARNSSQEQKLSNLLINNNIEFQHQYTIRQNGVTHAFDFAIFRHGELIALVDVDGLYYHAYLDDADGKQQRDEYDIRRTLCIPEGIKFVVVFEKYIEDGFNELCNILKIDYLEYVNDMFNWCRRIGFPYPKYADEKLHKSYSRLRNCEYFIKNGKIGERIIRHFHPSILHSHRAGSHSPYDGYMNDSLLEKVIKNRFIYKNNLEPSRILEGFNISKVAPKVSVFKPSLAKMLINTYLNEYETIFDPFSGFSGRMLGTCSLGKKYIGQDINQEIVKESNQIIEFFGFSAEVSRKDILESSGEYPCLFTCSPYSNKEIWGTETEFKTCDEWIDECLTRFKCSAYLFVVDETKKYTKFIVDSIENKSHFSKNAHKYISKRI